MPVADLIVQAILLAVGVYAIVGIGVAVWLHGGEMSRRDATAVGGGWGFRLLVTPGIVALWPLLLARPASLDPERTVSARTLRGRHRLMVQTLAVLLPILVGLAITTRPAPVLNTEPLPEALRQPDPLAFVLREDTESFAGYPVAARIRTDAARTVFQVELEVREPLAVRQPFLYFAATDGADHVDAASTFLGPVAGVGVHRFAFPASLVGRAGVLLIHDAAGGRGL